MVFCFKILAFLGRDYFLIYFRIARIHHTPKPIDNEYAFLPANGNSYALTCRFLQPRKKSNERPR